MSDLKCFISKVVGSVLSLLPECIKAELKQIAALRALHVKLSNIVAKPLSAVELDHEQERFHRYLNWQNTQLSELISKPLTDFDCNILICVPDGQEDLISVTLESISKLLCFKARVILWGTRSCTPELELYTSKLNLDCYFVTRLNDCVSGLLKEPIFIISSGDILDPRCLLALVDNTEHSQFAYVDTCIYLASNNQWLEPDFKPDFNPDFQYSNGYVNTGLWCKALESFSSISNQVTNHSIAAFVCHLGLNRRSGDINHIPWVLLAQRQAFDMSAGVSSLEHTFHDHAELLHCNKQASSITLNWPLSSQPLVSIIIPTHNAKALVKSCIDSILVKTSYHNFEIILVDNNSDDPESISYFKSLSKQPKITVIEYPHAFNYSAINNFAVKHAAGDVVALVNNDVEVISADWLEQLVRQVIRPDIGCVGAKLLYSNGTVQHAGVILGCGGSSGVAAHAHKHFPGEHPGYQNRLVCTHNVSAVTAACLIVKKSHYQAVGGLDELNLAVAFNDVDFCLKVLQLGVRNLFCAEAVLFHHESVSRGGEDTTSKQKRFQRELNYLKGRWDKYIERDPMYHPHLTKQKENFSINERYTCGHYKDR
ncbi:glycosyltransferase [Shewanella sp. WXL01]|uniref:glycosyltransferase family 2 protein n=1 Tax=Shewanella sp. WXL01 TaxID=2709721 RepID=UPI00143846EE|nr:glycosyltransferase family 2 protein [Shewanella sp. WXL01]NKF50096.1 glycosyltransferase [Shewanella sp. WXL01]